MQRNRSESSISISSKEDVTWFWLIQEARAVSLWSVVSILLRLGILLLIRWAKYRETKDIALFWMDPLSQHHPFTTTTMTQEIILFVSVLCGWIGSCLPSKVMAVQAPGFIFGHPWILYWVRDKTGVLPNVPIRFCEYMLGRIPLKQLLVVIPLHLVCIVSTSVFLRYILPTSISSVAFETISYSNDGNPWIVVRVVWIFFYFGKDGGMIIKEWLHDPVAQSFFFFFSLFMCLDMICLQRACGRGNGRIGSLSWNFSNSAIHRSTVGVTSFVSIELLATMVGSVRLLSPMEL